jgi:hypothetical protein
MVAQSEGHRGRLQGATTSDTSAVSRGGATPQTAARTEEYVAIFLSAGTKLPRASTTSRPSEHSRGDPRARGSSTRLACAAQEELTWRREGSSRGGPPSHPRRRRRTSCSRSSVVAAHVRDHTTEGSFSPAFGAITLFCGIAQLVGPEVGGFLAEHTGSFRWAFLVSAVGGVAGVAASAALPPVAVLASRPWKQSRG